MKNQKTFIGIILLVAALALAACGVNPVEQLEEAAAEQIAEQIIEQSSGVEDVEIDVDGDSVSYTVEDGEGGEISFDTNTGEDIDAIVGLGFNIPLPGGLTNGTVQQVEENGEVSMINAAFELDSLTYEQFLQEIHGTLLGQGFTFMDLTGSGATEPDPATMPMAIYNIESDGVQFTIVGDDNGVILGLAKE